MRRHSPKSAFSLLEMAIVLAVVGLAAGGIVGGKKLIQSSKLKAVIDDSVTYSVSVPQFKEKYGEYPGDFSQARQVWGTSVAADGDGNGKIDTAPESYLAWQHLAVAGMVRGTYTGLVGSGPVAGVNYPAGSIENSGYRFRNWRYQPADVIRFYEGDYTNSFLFSVNTTTNLIAPVLTGAQATMIDQKIDDGKPALGNVRTFSMQYQPLCVTDDGTAALPPTSTSANYVQSGSAPACSLIFMNTFKAASSF